MNELTMAIEKVAIATGYRIILEYVPRKNTIGVRLQGVDGKVSDMFEFEYANIDKSTLTNLLLEKIAEFKEKNNG